ncbi:MAG: hypothetical protein ACXV8O_01540 [Methylobacter sp.]
MNNEEQLTIAQGAELSAVTWADFVSRLRYDCVGKGVNDHNTADALFVVQAKRLIFGIDLDYTDKKAVICDESHWFSPQEYWDSLDEEGKSELLNKAEEEYEAPFLELDEYLQWGILSSLEEHSVVGWDEKWEYVNSHFTKDAAEAFIRRKKHDYPDGIRVYVESQYHAWEFNTIKQAILEGRITFIEDKKL